MAQREYDYQSEADHISKASPTVAKLYRTYRTAVLSFGNDVTIIATQKYVSFQANGKRFVNFWIHPAHFKLWLDPRISDPRLLATRTGSGHTLTVSDEQHFDYVLGLIKQAYLKNK